MRGTTRRSPISDLMHRLELKIPPPVVALLVALAMWGAWRFGVSVQAPTLLRWTLVIALAAVGAGFDLAALLAFRRARTTVNPMKPGKASSFVRSGVYRITRNPMYVGLFMLLCAWSAYLWSAWLLFGPLAFAVYITHFQIVPEEVVLGRLFGDEYARYKGGVRRWI